MFNFRSAIMKAVPHFASSVFIATVCYLVAGRHKQRHSGDAALYCIRVRSVNQWTWDAAQHIPTNQGLASAIYWAVVWDHWGLDSVLYSTCTTTKDWMMISDSAYSGFEDLTLELVAPSASWSVHRGCFLHNIWIGCLDAPYRWHFVRSCCQSFRFINTFCHWCFTPPLMPTILLTSIFLCFINVLSNFFSDVECSFIISVMAL